MCLQSLTKMGIHQGVWMNYQTGIWRTRQTGSRKDAFPVIQTGICCAFLSEISIRSHLSSWKPPFYAGTVMLRLTAAKRAFMNSPHAARHDGAAWSLFCSTYYSQHVHSPWTGNVTTICTRLPTSCTHAVNGYVGWSEDAGEMISL